MSETPHERAFKVQYYKPSDDDLHRKYVKCHGLDEGGRMLTFEKRESIVWAVNKDAVHSFTEVSPTAVTQMPTTFEDLMAGLDTAFD